MTPEQQSRLLELFAAFSQETLTEAEHQELQTVLRTEVEARRLWFLHQDSEIGLKCLTQVVTGTADHPVAKAPVSMHSTIADVGLNVHLPTSIVKPSRVSWFVRRNRMMTAVVLLCVSVVVTVGVHILRQPPGPDHTVGKRFAINQAGDFTVESPTHGTKFTLSDQKGKVIALHFLLKTECPFCLKLAHDYSQLATSNPDVLHLFLKPDSTDEIRDWAGKIRLDGLKNPPVIYRDPDARLAKEFGIPDGYQFHGQKVHLPALVLLDSSGKELFRYVGKDNTDRMKPDDFIDRLAMVTDHK